MLQNPPPIKREIQTIIDLLPLEGLELLLEFLRFLQLKFRLPFQNQTIVTENVIKPDAWGVLESLSGTIEAPADWAAEHDHYLYGTAKRSTESEL